jgi:glycosyltransferase involved in cell wall biosynthesis
VSDSQPETRAARPLLVLYLHPIGAFGGASRSLLELLRAFPAGAVTPRILAPKGQAATVFQDAGYSVLAVQGVTQFDCTRFGHYRGWRWLILLRELWYLPFTVFGLFKARRVWPEIDLIHANEVTGILAARLAKALFRKPLVVHVRSVQQEDGIPLRRKWLMAQLRDYADAVIAIDATVRASLPDDLKVGIVHNAFSHTSEAEASEQVAATTRRFHAGSLRVGMLGNLLALKGVYDLLRAAELCVRANVNVDFLVVGSNPRKLGGITGALLRWFGFAHDVESDVDRYIAQHGLRDRVHRIGFTPHIGAVYRAIDVLCFPSHLDAVGRPVLEAACFGVPSVVAVNRASPDTLVDGETGIRVAAHDPQGLATVFTILAGRREDVERMGAAARRLAASNFDARMNALRILDIYDGRSLGSQFRAVAARSDHDSAA